MIEHGPTWACRKHERRVKDAAFAEAFATLAELLRDRQPVYLQELSPTAMRA